MKKLARALYPATNKKGMEFVQTLFLAVMAVVLGVMLMNTFKASFGGWTKKVTEKVTGVISGVTGSEALPTA